LDPHPLTNTASTAAMISNARRIVAVLQISRNATIAGEPATSGHGPAGEPAHRAGDVRSGSRGAEDAFASAPTAVMIALAVATPAVCVEP
jgi:hypothetical protein